MGCLGIGGTSTGIPNKGWGTRGFRLGGAFGNDGGPRFKGSRGLMAGREPIPVRNRERSRISSANRYFLLGSLEDFISRFLMSSMSESLVMGMTPNNALFSGSSQRWRSHRSVAESILWAVVNLQL